PDLAIIASSVTSTLALVSATFSPASCALAEACIDAPGERKLLRFGVETENRGTADLLVGAPDPASSAWEWSLCHMHYHFNGYADYELVGPAGVVTKGRKQSFCIEDTDQIDPSKPGSGYNCAFQGISVGWADTYAAELDCQWIDVTDVPVGDY